MINSGSRLQPRPICHLSLCGPWSPNSAPWQTTWALTSGIPLVPFLRQLGRLGGEMTRQKTPHTQSQQNVRPEQTDLEPDQEITQSGKGSDVELYSRISGAETGMDRATRKLQTRSRRRRT